MSEESQTRDAVEQVTQDVKDVKLENGGAAGAASGAGAAGAANGTPAKNDDNAIPFKVIHHYISFKYLSYSQLRYKPRWS